MEWGPDGEKILTATTAPRLRIGNGFKVWHYSGALLHETAWPTELLQVIWQKYPDGVFKEKPISNVKVEGIEPSQPVSSKAVYVPPNIRSGSSIGTSPRAGGGGPDRGPIPGLPIGYKVSQGQRKKDRNAAKKKEVDGVKLNSNSDSNNSPIVRSGSKTQANEDETQAQNKKRNARRSPRQPNNQNHTNGNGTSSSHNITDSNTSTTANANANESLSVEQASFDSIENSQEKRRERRPRNRQRKPTDGVTSAISSDPEKDKRLRTVQQKLRDIAKLKVRRENGENLEANQLSKISSETELVKELNALKVDS